MNPINKVAGLILGAVTGTLTAFLQMPYAYYVFAKNRRAAGYSWPTTLLATATIGNFFALGTGIFAITNAWAMIRIGMKIGSAKGIVGAIKLPYTVHTEFQRRLASENVTNLFSQIGRLLTSGIDYLFDMDSKGNIGPSGFEQARESHARRVREMREHQEWLADMDARWERLVQNVQAEVLQRIPDQNIVLESTNVLLQNIKALASNEKQNVSLLLEAEIEEYKKAIQNLPPEERCKKEEALADYCDGIQCPITLDTSDNPITVELPNGKSFMYDYDALTNWIEIQGENAVETMSRSPLKNLAIHKGYSSQIIDFIKEVREINKRLSSEGENQVGIVATRSTLFGKARAATTQDQLKPHPTGSNTPTKGS